MMREDIYPDFSEICLVRGDLTEFNARRIGPDVRRIDVSYNAITKIKGLETCAENLEEVILDNNQLSCLEITGPFPKLHTLSLNKNKISNLNKLLQDLKTNAPNLRYLSLLGNPVCPDQLSDDFVDDSDYQIFRYHVLYHVRSLKFLDHRPVSLVEMAEARKPLYGNLKLYHTVPTPLPPSSMSTSMSTSTSPSTTSVIAMKGPAGFGKSGPGGQVVGSKSKQGKRKFKYLGKNSEGNRFIRDNDL